MEIKPTVKERLREVFWRPPLTPIFAVALGVIIGASLNTSPGSTSANTESESSVGTNHEELPEVVMDGEEALAVEDIMAAEKKLRKAGKYVVMLFRVRGPSYVLCDEAINYTVTEGDTFSGIARDNLVHYQYKDEQRQTSIDTMVFAISDHNPSSSYSAMDSPKPEVGDKLSLPNTDTCSTTIDYPDQLIELARGY